MEKHLETTVLDSIDLDGFEKIYGKSINIQISGIDYHLEIVRISRIVESAFIEKYFPGVKCAFIRDNGKTILAFDIREDTEIKEEGFVRAIIIKARRNNNEVPLGFIINDVDDFFRMVN